MSVNRRVPFPPLLSISYGPTVLSTGFYLTEVGGFVSPMLVRGSIRKMFVCVFFLFWRGGAGGGCIDPFLPTGLNITKPDFKNGMHPLACTKQTPYPVMLS